MILINAAGAYLEHEPEMFSVAAVLVFDAFGDMAAGIIAVMLPTRFTDPMKGAFANQALMERHDQSSDP
jgi:DNA-binding IclR family transcriptional regulator